MPPTPPQATRDENAQATPITSAPQRKSSGAGATVGIIIIVILMLFGALYFWGASLNANNTQEPLPLIPGDATTTL